MIADLHIHTTASDGRLSPNEILQQVIEVGLSYISITDHDTVDGLLEVYNLIDTKNTMGTISIIPGIEFSTDLPENEVHILGYHMDVYNLELQDQLNLLVAHRHERIKQMIHKVNQLGYAIDYHRVIEIAKRATSLGRPHLAKALVEKGYFSTVSEVFTTLLNNNAPAYIPHYKLTPLQVIALIKKTGGIPVLAHPGLIGNDLIVLDLIKAGILGLEVYHPTHNELQVEKYLNMAEEYQLLVTGGSDFHGVPTRFPEKLGLFTIPASLAKKLNEASQRNI